MQSQVFAKPACFQMISKDLPLPAVSQSIPNGALDCGNKIKQLFFANGECSLYLEKTLTVGKCFPAR